MAQIPQMKDPHPKFSLVREKEWTEDLLNEIVQPETTRRLAMQGNVGTPGYLEGLEGANFQKEIRAAVAYQSGSLPIVSHVIDEPGGWKRPLAIALQLDARGQFLERPGGPLRPFTVFSSPHLRFAAMDIISGDHSIVSPLVSRLFLEECRRVSKLLDASFAFGDNYLEFQDQSITDPRSRAWGVTYYGPKLAQEIGLERLRTAPVHKVEEEKDGGVWFYLDDLPFVPSPQMEARKDAVEHHLGLRERFPSAGGATA